MNPIRLIELFAGYGSQAMALKRLGLPFENHFVCDFDKYAIKSYNAVHGTDYEPIDIKNVTAADLKITDRDHFTYLLTYSFPCTDLSIAGKMEGMTKGTHTRSGLLWEVERILKECGENLPQFLFMENVPMVHGSKNIDDFNDWICFLDSLGYKSKWQDLNAKDYGVAPNRDRCFMVSWLEQGFTYMFPQPFKLDKTMRDYLDTEVDERYYLTSAKAQKLIEDLQIESQGAALNPNSKTRRARSQDKGNSAPTVTAMGELLRIEKSDEIKVVGRMDNSDGTHESLNRVYSADHLAPALDSMRGGNRQPKILDISVIGVMDNTDDHTYESCNRVYDKNGCSPAIQSRDYKEPLHILDETPVLLGGIGEKKSNNGTQYYQQDRVYSSEGVAMAHPSQIPGGSYNYATIEGSRYRIRKLTEIECLRLMGVSDEDARKMRAVNSATQCYKQAGNSIVVDVMVYIFDNLFNDKDELPGQMTIYDYL